MEAFTEGVQPITQLVIHSKELMIEEESVEVEVAGRQVEVQGFGSDLDREFFIIYLASPIQSGEVVRIALQFTSVLREDIMNGLYRSSYLDTLTNTTRCQRSNRQASLSDLRWIAATDFEPIDARRAFPCLDEPALKAVFNIRLGRLLTNTIYSKSNCCAPRRQHMVSLSNMPLARVEGEGEDWEWDVYQPTVPMSTYLIAFVVCEFHFVEQQV